MAMSVVTSKNALCTYYGTQATYVGLATAAQSTTSTVTSELTGGSPAYARVAVTWGTAALSAITVATAGVTINVPTTNTVTHALLCTAATGATLYDWCSVTSTTYNAQGSAVITPTFTMT
jgi:hypothetical protein